MYLKKSYKLGIKLKDDAYIDSGTKINGNISIAFKSILLNKQTHIIIFFIEKELQSSNV